MIIVTGGAGLIGSNLVYELNQRGEDNILIVDELDHDRKERNIGHLKYERLIGIKEFRHKLLAGEYDDQEVVALLHMGACSDTTEQDWNYLVDNNVEYSKDVIRWCFDHDVRCIYASSAATYGDGELGFDDDHELFDQLKPLNLYGKSKLLVDIWARDGGYLDKAVGLRYFNVYGPNEWHKEHMMSVVAKKVPEIQEKKYIELFKSYHPEFKDGEQERDFVYVKDAVAATLSFLDNDFAGVFNIGTGKTGTWNEVARAMFVGLGIEENIRYIDMPGNLKNQYQYHTQAVVDKLVKTGLKHDFMPVSEAVEEYVRDYLVPDMHLGE